MKFLLKTNIYHPKTEGGFDLLRLARENLSLPELPAELVDESVFSERHQRIILDEKTAINSGHFEKISFLEVIISKFNYDTVNEKYWFIEVDPDMETDGKVNRVSFKWRFDSKEFVTDWVNSGYPDNLDFAK
jgi:hypothetical protein